MIAVSEQTKLAWTRETSRKSIEVHIGSMIVSKDDILEDTFNLVDGIMASDSLEFVGCIAKKCEFDTNVLNNLNLKNREIKVYLRADNTDTIPVFVGYIDEAKKSGMQGYKHIVAYDIFYKLSQIDATGWWNGLGITTLVGSFINFINTFSVRYNPSAISFVNSLVTCYGGSKKQAKRLTALDYLMQLCQINGCIGYTDGEGRFGIRYIDAIAQQRLYPADSLFPSDFIYPSDYDGGSVGEYTQIPFYQALDYEDYSIKQIDKVTIRNTSNDVGVSYPYAGDNNYIIQGNIFAFDQSGSDLIRMAENIYNVVKNANFRPFDAKSIAFPWLECGDKVAYYDIDDNGVQQVVNFIIMSRQMSGDQMMWDTYSAEGEQDQRIFITDLQAELEDIQKQIDDLSGDTPDGSLYGMVAVEYTQPIETPTMGGYDETISGIATEVT